MKQRIRLIAKDGMCQRCRKRRAVVLFRDRTWCVVDAINEVIALRAALLSKASQKAC